MNTKQFKTVIFLDFDGVINSHSFFDTATDIGQRGSGWLDHNAVSLLNCLCKKTGAQIVVSSSWRYDYSLENLRDILNFSGLEMAYERVIGTIPWDPPEKKSMKSRAIYILRWLKSHPEVTRYVILDDSDLTDRIHHHPEEMAVINTLLYPFLVRTSIETGLLPEHLPLALNLLGFDKILSKLE